MFSEIIERIDTGLIKNKDQLEVEKLMLAKRYGIYSVVKNAHIIEYAKQNGRQHLIKFLKTKPIRTASGVANIAVMWKGAEMGNNKFFSCPANCVYCPQGENSPKAYTGVEPTTMRAKRLNYDPFMQVKNRIRQFHIIGHKTDKCELIIMGGTFTAMPFSFQEDFVKRCFDAFNGFESACLTDAQKNNETADNRCIGLTIETRADYCTQAHIEKMLDFGCTRVEIGVQTTSDELLEKIERGHDAQANIEAIKRLKYAGLKFTAHWMPGFTGLVGEVDIEEELRLFKKLFTPDYQPDELKIYPTLVIPGTKLYEMWKEGKYHSLEKGNMIELLVKMKEIVRPYVRIKRIMRDISEHEAEAGARTTNLRQLVKEIMQKDGKRCRCIRCREIGFDDVSAEGIEMQITEYDASEGKELFISFENKKTDKIIGFLRLRLDNSEIAKVRELHVYGEMTPIGEKIAYQHAGFGKRLMKKAEEIAAERGKKFIAVTSGIGVRNYYRKLHYVLEGNYMTKKL
ncbi:MAG: tRNA uridine(34) 5-carboxymethylaminomethyl modification radical SAM/GNAT enzyme Elp3 [Candidatus Aenigmarchaeota archaeon]|nr:tRNA uridine(34) 5-carboxymethylaminomethyl modification radical SAM/GNAT enzyme Elp3 [Candidatus Aenigmarchaeota archaeon]